MTEDFYYTIDDGVLRLSSDPDGKAPVSTRTVYDCIPYWPWEESRNDIYEVVIEDRIAPSTCRNMFSGLENLTEVEGPENLDTSHVTDMYGMFYVCEYLESLDMSGWDTSNVTEMTDMFYGCDSLETVTTNDEGIISEVPALTKVVDPTARADRDAASTLEDTISQLSATADALQAAVTALQGNITDIRKTLGSDPR